MFYVQNNVYFLKREAIIRLRLIFFCIHTFNLLIQLFRKDLISAMKLADTEILYEDEYFVISDPWRQEWEKGVQVPVNEEEIPTVTVE